VALQASHRILHGTARQKLVREREGGGMNGEACLPWQFDIKLRSFLPLWGPRSPEPFKTREGTVVFYSPILKEDALRKAAQATANANTGG
jgi:hypothetical protein